MCTTVLYYSISHVYFIKMLKDDETMRPWEERRYLRATRVGILCDVEILYRLFGTSQDFYPVFFSDDSGITDEGISRSGLVTSRVRSVARNFSQWFDYTFIKLEKFSLILLQFQDGYHCKEFVNVRLSKRISVVLFSILVKRSLKCVGR